MFNLGWGEILVIGVVALLLFGPSRLPQLAKSFGEAFRIFRKELKTETEEEKP
ncbi:MAG: twin-arginine translocase TatA/TatE family subunit [Elusimicrobia bacterium]|nr:twin-arginine translocase TatA/TatE family subunit [Elusimicrobiota bacterium]